MKLLKIISWALFAASLAALAFCVYLLVIGFPVPDWVNEITKMKDIRKPFQLFLVLFLAAILIHPKRMKKLNCLNGILSTQKAFWALAAVYTLLFSWHEIAEYLAIEINFIPFGFYDTMLYYIGQGKIHFTGYLHGFYHINNGMFLLWPVWQIFQSSLVLIFAYPVILVSAAIPLYYLARRYFSGSALPLVIAFCYLNYRYLQNMIEMNFTVESFYPVFILSAVYFAVTQKWIGYGLFVLLTLSVKEDAPFYMIAFGVILLFMRGKRWAGAATIAASAAYFYWIHEILVAWTGSDIFVRDAKNFREYGATPFEVIKHFVFNLPDVIRDFLGTKEARKTLIKAFGHLLFLPVLSPFAVPSLAALFPLFMQGGASFTGLQFQYAAPFIGFIFAALVDALRRLKNWTDRIPKIQGFVIAGLAVTLVFLNGGNFKIPRVDAEDLKTIAMAKSVPAEALFVTHGHLLPYIGYREKNYYFQQPYEKPDNPEHTSYANADYYLLARGVNLFPMDEGWFEAKLAELKARPDYELVQDDGVRYLFRKKVVV